MNISIKRIRAIFMKDYKEFSRNYAVSIMVIFPLFFAFLFRDGGEVSIVFLLNVSFAMLTTFVQACLIAEEKEKNTLRSLMMTPASMLDVLLGKSALVAVVSAIVMTLAVYIVGYTPTDIVPFVISMVLSIVLYTALGTICGLYSKTVLEASLAIFPVIIIFTMGPFGAAFEDKFALAKLLEYLPSSQLQLMLTNTAEVGVVMPLMIMLVWAIVVTAISFMLYKKRLMDA